MRPQRRELKETEGQTLTRCPKGECVIGFGVYGTVKESCADRLVKQSMDRYAFCPRCGGKNKGG